MTASARLLETARRILEEAGRPLSVRRILRTAERDVRFGGDAPSIEALGEALAAGAEDGVLVEQRRGVFSLADAGGQEGSEVAASEVAVTASPAEPAAEVEADPGAAPDEGEADDGDDRPRRRRRRRGQQPAETGPVAPPSLDGTAELSAGADDRDALKGKLWSRLRQRASQITEQPLAVEPEPPKRRRTRGPGDTEPEAGPEVERAPESAPPVSEGEAPRRRRRRRPSAEVDSAPTPQAAEAARTEPKDLAHASSADRDRRGTDLRATLKARLAQRSDAATDVERAVEAPAEVEPATPAPAADDVRGTVKSKLAARLRGRSTPAVEPTPSAPTASPAKEAASSTPAAPERSAAPGAEGVDLKARMRARLAARSGEPQAPASAPSQPSAPQPSVSSKPSAPPAGAGDSRSVLRSRLAARLGVSLDDADGAGEPVDAVEADVDVGEVTGGAAEPAAPADPTDLKARLKARIGRRGEAPQASKAPEVAAAPAPAPATAASDATELKARLKARLGRRGVEAAEPAAAATPAAATKPAAEDPLEQPLSDSRRPYREGRREPKPSAERERRTPVLAEVSRTSTLVSAALAALRSAGAALSLDALAAQVDATAEGGAGGLRAALIAENARRDQAGLRTPFVIHYGGEIGLTEWGLSARYRALEAQMQTAIAEQRELVRRDLLARIGDLSDAGFEQVLVMLLERLGYHAVEVVGRQGSTVALVVSRADEAGAEKIAVVARRAWSAIHADTVRRVRDTLPHFEAESGLVLTVGTFSQTARREARLDGQTHVRLVDGAGLARLLHEHGIGLASHQPVLHYVDVGFFESLER